MSRPRTATDVLDRKGAFDKNPNRRRGPEPKPSGPLGKAPTDLNERVVAAWDEIVSKAPGGVLTKSDELTLEIAARLLVRFRKEGLTAAELGHLRRMLGEMGMNPSARAKMAIEKPPKEEENPFADYVH